MGFGAGILLLATLGLFLIQNPEGLMPWEEPTLTPTETLIPPTTTMTETLVPTSTGTRRPTRTPPVYSETPTPTETHTPTITSTEPTSTYTPQPSATNASTQASNAASATPSNTSPPPTITDTPEPSATNPPQPTLTSTPLENPIIVTGRVVDQDNPIANVTITLEGPSVLTAVTDENGAYQFEVDWVDENFALVFSYESNTHLNPASNYVAWSWIEGILIGDLEIPNLEISSAPSGSLFEQLSPANDSSYAASQINKDNPIRFEWTEYPMADQYWIDLGREGEDHPVWSSVAVADLFTDFGGKLNNGSQISEGTYWWAVGTLRTQSGFRFLAYTHNWTLVITP